MKKICLYISTLCHIQPHIRLNQNLFWLHYHYPLVSLHLLSPSQPSLVSLSLSHSLNENYTHIPLPSPLLHPTSVSREILNGSSSSSSASFFSPAVREIPPHSFHILPVTSPHLSIHPLPYSIISLPSLRSSPPFTSPHFLFFYLSLLPPSALFLPSLSLSLWSESLFSCLLCHLRLIFHSSLTLSSSPTSSSPFLLCSSPTYLYCTITLFFGVVHNFFPDYKNAGSFVPWVLKYQISDRTHKKIFSGAQNSFFESVW